jgi:hypothetical protein
VCLRAYELVEGAKVVVTVPDMRGRTDSTFEVVRAAGVVTATRVTGSKAWQFMLANVVSAQEVVGGTAAETPEGLVVTPAPGSHRIEIRLPG